MGVAGKLNDNAVITAPVYAYWPNDYGLYNMAGNVSEWTSYFNQSDKPTPLGNAWDEFPNITGSTEMSLTELIPQVAIDNGWNSSEFIGRYFPGENNSGGALRRGGRWTGGGVFTANLNNAPANSRFDVGFRCSYHQP